MAGTPLPLIVDVDEKIGQSLCPMRHVEHSYDEDDRLVVSASACESPLYVIWSFTCPAGPGEPIGPEDAPGWAVSSDWRLECEAGHVIAVSGNRTTADDLAQPFEHDLVLSDGSELAGEG